MLFFKLKLKMGFLLQIKKILDYNLFYHFFKNKNKARHYICYFSSYLFYKKYK